jgi:hypothetical protein
MVTMDEQTMDDDRVVKQAQDNLMYMDAYVFVFEDEKKKKSITIQLTDLLLVRVYVRFLFFTINPLCN